MKNENFTSFLIKTPLLPLKATILNDEFLISLEFFFQKWEDSPSLSPLGKEVSLQIEGYFNKKLKKFDIPYIFMNGTPFQKSCWEELKKIPYGETITYQEEALRIENPKAIRAVGSANGKNPISIIIPCHRVISKNGGLGGYTTKEGSKIDIKNYLISLEKE